MKHKILSFFLVVYFSTFFLQAQFVVLHEDFSGSFPPTGWSTPDQTGNWSAVQSSNAGGTPPEVRLSWTPQFNGTTRLISPSLNLSDNTTGAATISFRQMIDHYGSNFQVGLSYREKGGAWINLWQQTVTSNIPAQLKVLNFDTDEFATNSSDIQFSLYFTGSSFNINYWYIDDFTVSYPHQFDLALSEINMPQFYLDSIPVSGKVINTGLETITHFKVNYLIDEQETISNEVSGLELDLNEEFVFTFDHALELPPSNYNLSMFISDVNGAEQDDNADNDTLAMTLYIPYQTVERKPLFESFTSSTCGPCRTFNVSFFNNFIHTNLNDLTIIKYQMNWPGAGDPYYTAEGGVRRNYYGVQGVPSLILDGNPVATNGTVVSNAFNAAKNTPGFMKLSGNSYVHGSEIAIDVEIVPYISYDNMRMHAVVLEKETTGNTGTNGETSFKYVMMKMVPNAQGSTIDIVANELFTQSFSIDLSNTFIEEYDDLAVVLFLQDHTSKKVFQSAFTDHIDRFEVHFDVEDQQENVEADGLVTIQFNVPVSFTDESEITNENVSELITYQKQERDMADVPFLASITEDKQQITIEPLEVLDFQTLYKVELAPVLLPGHFVSEPYSITFTTRESVGAPVVVFSLDDGSVDVGITQAVVMEINQQASHQNGDEITAASLPDLIMFYEDDLNGESVAFEASVNEEKTLITVTPAGNLQYDQQYLLGVDHLLGEDNELSDPVYITFTTAQDPSLSIDLSQSHEFNLYPNPATDRLMVMFPSELSGATIRVFNIVGQLVLTKPIAGTKAILETSTLTPGLFTMEITGNGHTAQRRFAVVKK